MQNSILSRHYANYLEMLANNKKLVSTNLTELQIQNLYDKKYNLTEFEIYKYITALDFISDSLGCSKYNLTEGCYNKTEYIYKYNNILIDLFYQDIPSEIITDFPISTIFVNKDLEWGDNVEIWEDDDEYLKINNKNIYSNYTGNFYTYYIFKQLIKLFLTEVYLYKFNNKVLTYLELLEVYKKEENTQSKTISQFINDNKITKIKYQCIKVIDPQNIDINSILDIKIYLIDISKLMNFNDTYDTLIKKEFNSFWN